MATKRIVFSPVELVEVFNNPDLFSALMEVLSHDLNRPVKDAISTARYAMRQYALMFPAGTPLLLYSVDGTGSIVVSQPKAGTIEDLRDASLKQQRADKPKNVPEGT